MEAEASTVTVEVLDVVVTTLGTEDRVASLDATSPLFGELPEPDPLGVVELAAALATRFGIEIDDEDFAGDVFETMGTLTDFVTRRSEMTSYGDSAQWSGRCP